MRLTWLLYAMPFLALGGGILIAWVSRRNRVPPPPPLNAADQARLDELLR
jgi:cytochrome c-type biogenesis protein CcmH/NrfF